MTNVSPVNSEAMQTQGKTLCVPLNVVRLKDCGRSHFQSSHRRSNNSFSILVQSHRDKGDQPEMEGRRSNLRTPGRKE